MTTALALDRPISMLPVLRAADCIPTRSDERSVLDVGSPLLVARGAVAILLALRHARIGSGAEVLVPAFNCPSMIAPVRAAGAAAVPYAINEDLSIDTASLERLITSRTRALLAAHLLGRINDLAGIKTLCEERGIVLIEDCAHAFFGATAAGPVGSTGHYAVASPTQRRTSSSMSYASSACAPTAGCAADLLRSAERRPFATASSGAKARRCPNSTAVSTMRSAD